MIFAQRDSKWKDIKLGFGVGTIGQFGCTITSVAMCLQDAGYTDITPIVVNDKVKSVNGFVGDSKNLLDWKSLEKIFPITYIGSFNYDTVPAPIDQLAKYLSDGYSVLIKLRAANIGGSGDHFVKANRVEGANVIVQDPWYGEEAPITKRFTRGTADTATEIITGFRVMKVTKNTMPNTNTVQVNEADFITMRTKSDQSDALAKYFSIPQADFRADQAIKIIDKLKEDNTNLGKALTEANKTSEDLRTELSTEKNLSKKWRDDYNGLIQFFATTLGCSLEEPVIRAKTEELIGVEDKLRDKEKEIETLKTVHAKEKEDLKKELADLRLEVNNWKKQAETFEGKFNDLEKKFEATEETLKQIGLLQKFIADIVGFLSRFKPKTIEKAQPEEKNVKSDQGKNSK